MKKYSRIRFRLLLGVTVLISSSCRRPDDSESVSQLARRVPKPVVARVSATTTTSVINASSTAANASRPATSPGDWTESSLYKFRIVDIHSCKSRDSSSRSVASVRLGVEVNIVAKVDEVLASPRDVSIEKDGIVFQALPHVDLHGGCGRLLEPKQLRRGELASGVVIFELPEKTYARSAVLAFEPTRWGGAPRVQVSIPDCVDACGEKRGY